MAKTNTPSLTDPAGLRAEGGNENYREFIENLPVMFYAVSPTAPHRPLYISPTFEDFGYPLSDWLENPDIWDRVMHPDDRHDILAKTRAAMRRGEGIDFEYRVVCRDGRIKWVRDRSCFIKDRSGSPLCWQGVILDITDHKNAQQELEKREKLYRTLARTIPKTAVLIFDHDFRYTLADGEQLRKHKWSAEMFENKTLYDIFDDETVDEWEDYYRRALAGEEVVIEHEIDDRAYVTHVRPVRDETGEIFAGFVMWRDVTDVKQANDAIRQSEARYRQLFENANDIIYVHDLQGNYISINHAAERIFGYSREEAMALNMRSIIAPEHVKRVQRELQRKIAGDAGQTVYEVNCIRKDGRRATLEVNSSIILQNGEPIAVQGIARDITERKATEEALRKSEQNLAAAQRITHLGSWELEIRDVNDAERNIVTWSDEVYRIFGYKPRSPRKITSKFVYSAVHREDRRRVSAAFYKAAIERKFLNIEAWIVLPDKSEKFVSVQAETVYDEKTQQPIKMVGTVQDITERHNAEQALKLSEARFRDLFENANDLIYTHDLHGNFTSLNRAGEVITGYSRDEALRMNISEVVAPEFLDMARTMTSRKLAGDLPSTYELEIIAKGGHRVVLEINTRLIVSDGMPVGVQGIGRDISERRQAEQSLHNALSLLSSTFESTADGIIVMSLDRRIITCNHKFVEMWGVGDDILDSKDGQALIELISAQLKDKDEFLRQLDTVYSDTHAVATQMLELKDGRTFERYSQPQYLEGEPVGRVACFRDITERTQAEERLRHYALHDTLTDLPNRVSFMNHLRQAVERQAGSAHSRFAVLFLDLDRFKVINDSLGHAVGDKLLVAISERLTSCVRPGDVVARLGGDEFTILLNRTGDTDEVVKVAERLQSRISAPFKIDNYEVFTTASIGIIVSNDIPRAAEDLLRDADAAMYRAKESGKARHEIFDLEMHVRNMNLLRVETDLRHAVDRNEFEVLYQPIVDMVTGRVNEFEALIRWRHPVHGLVSPNEFIHVAEETGLIIPIGKWIIEESCRQIAEWQRRFRTKLSVSVNLSAKQLMHPSLTGQVREIIAETGLEPNQLKLEVTESTVMEHSELALKILCDLDRMGVNLSTDDFGTGYSSLSYLQRFPFERLKIDRSFINVMDADEKSGAIVKTILMLGDNLGIEVVAEGIETISQLEKLRALGCTIGQGFLFSRPVDSESVCDLLENGANVFTKNPALQFSNVGPMIEVADVQ
jgi:diguanylate cyclase (GGDEF)-like protein/PAS domain S-box-containing protein